VLKSLCVKTKNKNINNYLLESFQKLELDNMYISHSKFKIYKNVIVHYNGKDVNLFLENVSNILTNCIIKFYESKILKNIIRSNYFYFTDIEQRKILNLCTNHLKNNELTHLVTKKSTISVPLFEYFSENKSLILDGFVCFRVKEYIKLLDSIVDLSVNKFVIDREYAEFIDLLKMYINSKDYGCDIIHLIYKNQESILLDEFKNIIEIDSSKLNSKYLSDISFSSNDFALNSLLTSLPKLVYIHIVSMEDEFINTLKLIFENRVFICNDCNLCKMYRLEKIKR